MPSFGLGRTVKVVNRVRDADGKPVRREYMVGGEAFWIEDTMDLPLDVARIAIHQSMWKVDPVTGLPQYRLGCKALDVPEDPIPLAEVLKSNELIDRELSGSKVKAVPIYNPITPRRDAHRVGPGQKEDGVFAGSFGDKV